MKILNATLGLINVAYSCFISTNHRSGMQHSKKTYIAIKLDLLSTQDQATERTGDETRILWAAIQIPPVLCHSLTTSSSTAQDSNNVPSGKKFKYYIWNCFIKKGEEFIFICTVEVLVRWRYEGTAMWSSQHHQCFLSKLSHSAEALGRKPRILVVQLSLWSDPVWVWTHYLPIENPDRLPLDQWFPTFFSRGPQNF